LLFFFVPPSGLAAGGLSLAIEEFPNFGFKFSDVPFSDPQQCFVSYDGIVRRQCFATLGGGAAGGAWHETDTLSGNL
jgi:hypothetical protein